MKQTVLATIPHFSLPFLYIGYTGYILRAMTHIGLRLYTITAPCSRRPCQLFPISSIPSFPVSDVVPLPVVHVEVLDDAHLGRARGEVGALRHGGVVHEQILQLEGGKRRALYVQRISADGNFDRDVSTVLPLFYFNAETIGEM